MKRRAFLASSIAATAAALAAPMGPLEAAQTMTAEKGREFYQLRRYRIRSGPQRKLCDDFFRDALIPALNRLSVAPVGVFDLMIGAETPTIFVLMPGMSAETLVTIETHLEQDAEFMKSGAAVFNAPEKEPAFQRMESSFLQAFPNWPKLVLPRTSAMRGPRLFELRIYEGASELDHHRKMEMMQSGEVDIFNKAGFDQIFYSETLIGPRLPNLTYMVGFENLAAREKQWAAFFGSDEWKALSTQPKYTFEPVVSNSTSLILTPTAYSQI